MLAVAPCTLHVSGVVVCQCMCSLSVHADVLALARSWDTNKVWPVASGRRRNLDWGDRSRSVYIRGKIGCLHITT